MDMINVQWVHVQWVHVHIVCMVDNTCTEFFLPGFTRTPGGGGGGDLSQSWSGDNRTRFNRTGSGGPASYCRTGNFSDRLLILAFSHCQPASGVLF